jgi:hypothetical protein
MRLIFPGRAALTGESLAALYAYPDLADGAGPGAPGTGRWLRANMVGSLDGAAANPNRAAW